MRRRFILYRRKLGGTFYVEDTETRKQGGWLKSVVFGKSFRLTRRTDRSGNPQFTLEVK